MTKDITQDELVEMIGEDGYQNLIIKVFDHARQSPEMLNDEPNFYSFGVYEIYIKKKSLT